MTPANPLYWLAPWEPSITVSLTTAAAALCYIRGCANTSYTRRGSFWAGLALFYIACHTQLDYYSEHEFFMHRLQHSILHHLAPFLIALSRPGAALAQGTPLIIRQKMQAILSVKPMRYLIGILNHPIVAPTLFCGLILFWLVPSIHFIGMLDARLYRLMNWGMAINGLMFWNLVLNNYALQPAQISPAGRIAMMLAIIVPQIVFGMLIFLSPHELYPIYSLCGRAFNLTPLEDQHLGGLILWISAAMMSVIGILLVMWREWMSPQIA